MHGIGGIGKFEPNRYQIIGLILSVIWIVAASLYAHNEDVQNADNFANFSGKVCADGVKLKMSTPEKCRQERIANVATFMDGDTGNVLFLAFAPLPIFWLVGFCLLYFFRAQVIGFRAVIPWGAFSWQKRTFVGFCVLFVVACGFLELLAVLNDHVDSEVPVSPTIKSFVNLPANGTVEVVGTWTRPDLTDDTIANPLQTSRISCNKSQSKCIEAKAYISGNSLFSDYVEYDVQSWTASTIIFRSDSLCATEIYTIDLNSEIVSGVGHKANMSTPFCDTSFTREGPDKWTLLLEDGFKVYWSERQKRRPWLLRVMQTLLGN